MVNCVTWIRVLGDYIGKKTITSRSIRLDDLLNHISSDLMIMLNCNFDGFGLLDIDLVKIRLPLVR